jgi:hypothetical protein
MALDAESLEVLVDFFKVLMDIDERSKKDD